MSPEGLVAHLQRVAPETPLIWLDDPHGDSVVAWAPAEIVRAGDWVDTGRRLSRKGNGGGVLGFLGYGAGHHVEAVPAEGEVPEGESWLGRFEGLARYDGSQWQLTGRPSFRRQAQHALEQATEPAPPPDIAPRVAYTVDRDEWLAQVQAVRELLFAGDAYQVNLTRPVWVDEVHDPLDCYRRLRRASPAAYGAFLQLGTTQLLCNSPELLLEVRGALLASDPIKGTRPRHHEPTIDRILAQELLDAAKDHAELTMIIDLVRNDLGRVATPGSVQPGARRLTSHATVHHTSCRVEAELRAGLDPWHALAACFPPGSVTGAPKVRACQRIAELEAHPRGVYCGTIGGLFDDGRGAFNVAIRTAICHGGAARFHVGGGIVVDSDPTDEWAETEHKGRALLSALAGRAS